MEKLLIAVLLCVIVYLLFRGEPSQAPSSATRTVMTDGQREEFKRYFKSSAERITKDAAWTGKHTFKVGVLDDGSNRDEYARYVCRALERRGFEGHGVTVEVIDVMKRGGEGPWIRLGEAHCGEHSR